LIKDNGTLAWNNAFGDTKKNSIPPIENHYCEKCGKLLHLNKWEGNHIKFVLTCRNHRCSMAHNSQGYILGDGSYLRSRFVALPEGITIGDNICS